MTITDLNPAGGIGSNCLLLEWDSLRIIIDAGLNPARLGKESLPALDRLRGKRIDLVLLSHCHLDHIGALPVLLREHPDVKVVLSQPSQMLAARMLHNSVNVMTRLRDEKTIVEYPLYTHREVERIKTQFMPLLYTRTHRFECAGAEVAVTLFPAGHVPGAAAFQIEHNGHRLFHTGDCQFANQRTLPGAAFPAEPYDVVVTETTRGTTSRAIGSDRAAEVQRFIARTAEVLDNGGSVLVPTFAFGRMQEMMMLLHDAKRAGSLPRVPVYASGLGVNLADLFDEIARKLYAVDFRKSVMKDLRVRSLPEPFQPASNGTNGKPALYILSSGMVVEKTPSYIAAAHLLGDARNAVHFVGYCSPETPGGQILELNRGDPFLFEERDVLVSADASVERFDLSSHADRDELIASAESMDPQVVVLTHGDDSARKWFTQELPQRLPGVTVIDPIPLELIPILD